MVQAITKFPRLRVLVIEDHVPHVELLESMLLYFSCDFEIVDTSHHGIDLHIKNPFHVIVMDILAPGIDGFEAVQKIKKMSSPAGSAHIITLINHAEQKNTMKWLNSGVCHHIKKPLKIQDLEQAFLKLCPATAHTEDT